MKILVKHSVTIILIFFLLPFSIIAQNNTSGTVKYENVTKFAYTDPSGGQYTEFMKTLPKSKTITQMLYFDNVSSVFEEENVVKEELSNQMKKAMYFTKAGQTPSTEIQKVYYNFEKNNKIEQILFMTRMFLIETDFEKKDWKITSESKEILGYKCQKAVSKNGNNDIIAWFTTEIPVSAGPAEYIGLPGLVLEVNVNKDQMLITAKSINLKTPGKKQISKPKEGKKISSEDFEKTKAKKIKDWEKNKNNKNVKKLIVK
ncbi:GLPGLI family protein [Bacteroidota bacterium]